VLGLPTAATTRATATRDVGDARQSVAVTTGGFAGVGEARARAGGAREADARARTTASARRAGDAGDVVARAYAQLAQYPRVLLPTMDAAVYVNAKQYDAIVRRRQKRARANATRTPGVVNAKHPSRSAHAKNRIRGKNGKYLTRDELLRGLGGPEGRARAEAREREIAEREAKRVERAAVREATKARARAQRAAADAVRAAKKSRK
jgi:nuclear transcription factor Y alpha